ncbi:MAG TPA: pseudouridine synthase [Armatimonadota bacterium]
MLAAAGVASRRDAEKLILSGRVAVNGKVVTQLGVKIDPEQSTLTLDGKPVDLHPKLVYILLNKPRGYTSTRKDPHAKQVVTDLIKNLDVPVYPVGRLDVDTEGLLILTNDGDFTLRMTHPRHHVPKTYRAEVAGEITPEALRQLAVGVQLEDGKTSPAKVRLEFQNTAKRISVVQLVLTEGRKRQVRRMLAAVGSPVLKLERTKIGNLTAGKLKPGQWRFLRSDEVRSLVSMAS